MKGVSAIIATILLLMITIGLVGTAYVFISGMMTSKTSKAFEILDSSDYLLIVKNIGTDSIDSFTVVVDNMPKEASIKDGSIPANGVGIVVLEDVDLGNHNLIINTPSMSQRLRLEYDSPFSVVETQFFNQDAADWTVGSGTWNVVNGEYNQQAGAGNAYSYTDVGTDFNATYQLDFVFLSSTSVNITVASSTTVGDGITTVFDKTASQIRLLRSGILVDSTPYTFATSVVYSIKIEIGDGTYRLYLNGQQISDLDNTLNPSWIRGTYLQLITRDAQAKFDNIIVGSLSPAATTTTSTSATTSTSTTITTTTTTVGSTTTSTTSSSTTTTIASCSTCPGGACTINCGQTLSGRSTSTQEYFTFTLAAPVPVTITVTPSSSTIYDLIVIWSPIICPSTSDFDCYPGTLPPNPQVCTYPSLPAGTYYIMVKYTPSLPGGTYDLNLSC